MIFPNIKIDDINYEVVHHDNEPKLISTILYAIEHINMGIINRSKHMNEYVHMLRTSIDNIMGLHGVLILDNTVNVGKIDLGHGYFSFTVTCKFSYEHCGISTNYTHVINSDDNDLFDQARSKINEKLKVIFAKYQ